MSNDETAITLTATCEDGELPPLSIELDINAALMLYQRLTREIAAWCIAHGMDREALDKAIAERLREGAH